MLSAHWRWTLLVLATAFLLGACNLDNLLNNDNLTCPDPSRQEAPGVSGAANNPMEVFAGNNSGFGFYPCGYQHFFYSELSLGTNRTITVGASVAHDLAWELYDNSVYVGTPLASCDTSLTAPESCSTGALNSALPYYLLVISYEDAPVSGSYIDIY